MGGITEHRIAEKYELLKEFPVRRIVPLPAAEFPVRAL